MRTLIASSLVVLLSACASQAPAPAEMAAAPAAAAAKPGPQCYSGDHSRFFNVNDKATIAGVNVVCKATADGKAAQWMGDKH